MNETAGVDSREKAWVVGHSMEKGNVTISHKSCHTQLRNHKFWPAFYIL